MKRGVIVVAAVLLLLLPATTAFAANSNASCTGLGISDHAQAGEMPETLTEVMGFLAAFDVNVGEFVSEFAQVHAGTHDPGCESAAEEIIGDLIGG